MLIELKNAIKKEKLFCTEDGVDIFEGDYWHYVKENCTNIVKTNKFKYNGLPQNKKPVKRFSTKEAAEEYILMNKPCLSLNDVAQFYSSAVNGKSANSKNIINFVKSKL